MDAVICTSDTRLFTAPLTAMAEALTEQGWRVGWVKHPGQATPGAPELVIVTSDHAVSAAKGAYPGARVVSLGVKPSGGVSSVLGRFSRLRANHRLTLLSAPRGAQGSAGVPQGVFALPRLPQPQDPTPVWLHAMPKDIPTALVWAKTPPDCRGGVYNLICFGSQPGIPPASNTYFKGREVVPHALPFAQLAVVEQDEAQALSALRHGLPVVLVTDSPETPFARALETLGLGLATFPDGISHAMDQIVQIPGFAARAEAHADAVDAAPSLEAWAGWLTHATLRPARPSASNVQPLQLSEAG